MLRLAAFRPNSDKVTKLQLHPTYPWLASADEAGNVVVWDWEHRQVIYEVNAIGVDERRLVGAQLQGEAEPKISKISQAIKDIKGGSVKQVKFYDDDVRYWQGWLARAAVSQNVTQEGTPPGGHQPTGPGPAAIRGRHFLVICCDSKAIFLDMVTMRAKDVPKLVFDNKSPLCVEFLPRSGFGDGPLAAFGGPDGSIRILSMQTYLIHERFIGAHKGPVACLKTLLAVSGETLLVSGGNDGLMTFWSVDAREAAAKLSVKAHDGGVVAIEVLRVQGGPPQLVTIGADKSLAIWDSAGFKELRRMKPAKVPCTSVATWAHPRAPNLNILTCAKDSHIWTVEHSGGGTRPLCDLTILVPPAQLPPGKKLKTYSLAVHPLQPHLVAAGTNLGVVLCEFDAKAVPAVVSLPTPVGIREHKVICNIERELRLLTFQLASHINPAIINAGDTGARFRTESPAEAPSLLVKQTRTLVGPVTNNSAALLAASHSGKYVSVVWPDLPAYEIYQVSNWALVDQGVARHFAWDSCKDRYAVLQTISTPKVPPPHKHGSSRKAREAAAAHAAALAAQAAQAAAAAKVEVRILLEDGSSNLLIRAIDGRSEPVMGLQGGALLGVAYKFPRRTIATAGSTAGYSSDDGLVSGVKTSGEAPPNFQFYSWENFKPVSQMLPQPEWTAWDQTVEYCALAYQRYIVISSLRPQYRFLGTVAIGHATGGVWHRRQLFIATPTTIECVFVDAGVSAVDLERKKRKEELKAQAAQARAVAEQGELALLTVDAPKAVTGDRVALRPAMLQVVRLASFHTGPSVPPSLNLPKQAKPEGDVVSPLKDLEERRGTEAAIGGGGVSVAVSRLPQDQKRPVGPLVVVGVRDGVLWVIDMFMTAHAVALSHPGIRCRCLAAYGDAVSAVKWASRLGREHHDDLAQFMLGMGYASEALHLPGISKRLEFDLAIQSGDLKRALQALITLSNSKDFNEGVDLGNDSTGVLSVTTNEEAKAEAVFGIVKFAQEFLDLIDAADATGQGVIARHALTRLAAAGTVDGGLSSAELRALSFRLVAHGEMTRLALQANKLISAGRGPEAALASAFLGDPNLLERAWQETGMFSEATLHAQAHGRSSLKGFMQQWNKVLQKEYTTGSSKALPEIGSKVDPVLAALVESGALTPQKDGVLQSLSQPKAPVIQILPPAVVSTPPSKTLTTKPGTSAGPMLALPPPTAAQSIPSKGDGEQLIPPTTGVPPTSAGMTAPKSDEQLSAIPNGVVPQAGAAQPPPVAWTAADLQQLDPKATMENAADPGKPSLSEKSDSAVDLTQLTSTAPNVASVASSGFGVNGLESSGTAGFLSQPVGPGGQAFPPPSAQPPGAGFQRFPPQPTQPLGPGFQGFPQASAQPFGGPGLQAFPPQSAQPFDGSGFQAFPGPSTPQFGPGFQAFSQPQQFLQSFGSGFQSFPPPNQAVTQGFQAVPQSSTQSPAPTFQAVPPSNGPQATSPSPFPFPAPPGRSGGGHRSVPLPGAKFQRGAQAFPFPMSTSTSVGGPPSQRGSQISPADLQLVPVGGPTRELSTQFSSSDLQLVPVPKTTEAPNDRPFF